ncbi:dTDP-4-dehydrorhamnose reductase, partial [Xanthovirga aplysinae]|uniref:dTDP-4-dehydrorhamnose reductase n=1 Tax=Xanthovirga aplysinae TaxID=2529853 RepID=UPI0012BBA27C
MSNILVVGSNGQLGREFQAISKNNKFFEFKFVDVDQLDITSSEEVIQFFVDHTFDYCINCAAFTAVDKSEEEKEFSFKVNIFGVRNLAKACARKSVKFIHISTDFVFDGNQSKPYRESDKTNPINVYGLGKMRGEKEALLNCTDTLVVRTSWLYSSFGGNFVKTMLNLAQRKKEINVVADQIGTPTYAHDLAKALLKIISSEKFYPGIYHYSNEGVASWYDFSKAIFEILGSNIKVKPINSIQYPTPAKRPHFSVLDKSKIKDRYRIEIPHWRESLNSCL